MFAIVLALLGALVAAFRPRASLVAEILVLRQQLAVLKRRRPRPPLRPIDRAFWVLISRVWSRWADALAIDVVENSRLNHRVSIAWGCGKARRARANRTAKEERFHDDKANLLETNHVLSGAGATVIRSAHYFGWDSEPHKLMGRMRGRCRLLGAVLACACASPAAAKPCPDVGFDKGACAYFITPAFVASSSIQPYVGFSLAGTYRSAPIPPFAGRIKDNLTEYGVTASPQFGFAAAPFLLLYVRVDGVATSGGNVGTLIGQGTLFAGDVQLGAVARIAQGDDWRLALNGRLLRGHGEAIQIERALLGISENVVNSPFIAGVEEIAGAAGNMLVPYSTTSGRLDFTAAYVTGHMTLQGAVGGESIRQDFSTAAEGSLSRVVTTAAPRMGIAVGLDPELRALPIALLAEYQITVNRSWFEMPGQVTPSPARITETVAAVGIYSSRFLRQDLQLGVVAFDDFGIPNNLVTAAQPIVTSTRPQAWGAVWTFRYFF